MCQIEMGLSRDLSFLKLIYLTGLYTHQLSVYSYFCIIGHYNDSFSFDSSTTYRYPASWRGAILTHVLTSGSVRPTYSLNLSSSTAMLMFSFK